MEREAVPIASNTNWKVKEFKTHWENPLPKQATYQYYMSSIVLIQNKFGPVSANRGCPIRAPGVTALQLQVFLRKTCQFLEPESPSSDALLLLLHVHRRKKKKRGGGNYTTIAPQKSEKGESETKMLPCCLGGHHRFANGPSPFGHFAKGTMTVDEDEGLIDGTFSQP